MLCPNCKNEVGNVKFCPYCGSAVQTAPAPEQPEQQTPPQAQPPVQEQPAKTQPYGQAVPQQQPPAQTYGQAAGQQVPQYPYPPQTKPAKVKKPKGKKKRGLMLLIPGIAVLLAALIACSCLIPALRMGIWTPMFSKGDNPFAQEMKNAKKGSDAYELLEVFSAAHNTLFNSTGFSARISDGRYTVADIKLRYGKDIASSAFYLSAEDEYYAALRKGEFICTDGYDCVKIDVKSVLDGESEIRNALQAFAGEGRKTIRNMDADDTSRENLEIMVDAVDDLTNALDTSVFALIKNDRLNLSALNELFRYVSVFYMNYGFHGEAYIYSVRDFSYWYGLLASFIASGADGAFSVTKFDSTYNVRINPESLLYALADYIAGNAEIRRLITADLTEELANEIRKEARYADDTISFSVKLKKHLLTTYVSEISFGDSGRIIFSDFNSAKVSEDDVSRVTRAARKAEQTTVIRDGEDLAELIDEYLS